MEEEIDLFIEYIEEWAQGLGLDELINYRENPRSLQEDIEQILVDENAKYEKTDIEELAAEVLEYSEEILYEEKHTILNDIKHEIDEILFNSDPHGILIDEDILKLFVTLAYEFS